MRILYLQTFPLWGSGSGTYARNLAITTARNHTVGMVVPDTRTLPKVTSFPVDLPVKVAFTSHPEWPQSISYTNLSHGQIGQVYQAFLDATIKAVTQFRPDVIHVHHAFLLSWVAGFIRDTYGIPFIVTIHGSELPTLEIDKRYYQRTYDAMYRAKRIVPNSGWTREWFLKIFKNHFHEKCRVIPGGVNIDRFKKILNTDTVDRELGIRKTDPLVVFAGKLTPYKGVKYLIAAAKKINAHVLIVGDGPEKQALQAQAESLQLKTIHWVGHLADNTNRLTKYYSRANVFVAPSVWDEPLGLVILEAMACKTPVVVTRKGGISLAVKEGVNGYFVRPRNATQISEKVNLLLSNPEKCAKMGELARKIAERKFSWEIIGRRFEVLYRRYGKKK